MVATDVPELMAAVMATCPCRRLWQVQAGVLPNTSWYLSGEPSAPAPLRPVAGRIFPEHATMRVCLGGGSVAFSFMVRRCSRRGPFMSRMSVSPARSAFYVVSVERSEISYVKPFEDVLLSCEQAFEGCC